MTGCKAFFGKRVLLVFGHRQAVRVADTSHVFIRYTLEHIAASFCLYVRAGMGGMSFHSQAYF